MNINKHFTTPIIIGLEIHVELNTKTKLFCSCPTQGDESPNTRTCEICLGMPGSKPVVNKKAVEFAVKLALSLKCSIAKEIVFSRKSYFYPDMAKNYQITQYEIPIGENGYIEINEKKVHITRVHAEEDPASLIHPGGIDNSSYVLVDYNRSGNPLCEVVTQPEIYSPEEAREFMKALITILQYLNIFDSEKNVVKADANVSIKETGYVRVEIKNITGFKEIEKALLYEIERQKQEGQLHQETRAWNAEKGCTILLRTKETEDDYGYIFDPDLVPIDISENFLKTLKIPEMPAEKAKRYIKEYKLTEEDASVITSEFFLTDIFEKASKKVNPVLAAKWIRRELVRVLNYNKIDISDIKINVEQFILLLSKIEKSKITEKVGQRIIEKLIIEDIDIDKYIKDNDLGGVVETDEIEKICIQSIKENPKAVVDYKQGKTEALNFLLGVVMKKSKGKADHKVVVEILKKLVANSINIV